MDTEVVYLGHDNTLTYQLLASSSAASLGSVTQITLTLGSVLIANSSASSGTITWAGSGFSTGEIRLKLGDQSISAGTYHAPLIVYDAVNSTGIVWDYIPLRIKSEVEASAP